MIQGKVAPDKKKETLIMLRFHIKLIHPKLQ